MILWGQTKTPACLEHLMVQGLQLCVGGWSYTPEERLIQWGTTRKACESEMFEQCSVPLSPKRVLGVTGHVLFLIYWTFVTSLFGTTWRNTQTHTKSLFHTKFSNLLSNWFSWCSFCVGFRKWWHHHLRSLMPIVTWSHEHVPETTRPTIRLCLVGPAGPLAKKV